MILPGYDYGSAPAIFAMLALALAAFIYGVRLYKRRQRRLAKAAAEEEARLKAIRNTLPHRQLTRMLKDTGKFQDMLKWALASLEEGEPLGVDSLRHVACAAPHSDFSATYAALHLDCMRRGDADYDTNRRMFDMYRGYDRTTPHGLDVFGTTEEELENLRKVCAETRAKSFLEKLVNLCYIDYEPDVFWRAEREFHKERRLAGKSLEDMGTGKPELRDLRRVFHKKNAEMCLRISEDNLHSAKTLKAYVPMMVDHLRRGDLMPEDIGITAKRIEELKQLCRTRPEKAAA